MFDIFRKPAWLFRTLRHGLPTFPNLSPTPDIEQSAQARAALLAREMDRSLVWEDLEWLRGLWNGPLLIKGILHPDDARQARLNGVDGLIVSNHGGRQLDAAPSTIAVLPAIVNEVGGRVPVFVDSGFRRGSDIVKALASGAQGVFIGRAPLYGLASGGETAVRDVLELLKADIMRNMTLIGASRPADLGRAHLAFRSAAGHFHLGSN
jgi:(S)-mandelate dehydrogenase